MLAEWDAARARAARHQMSASQLALAESSQRYRSLFDYNPHAAFSLDLEGRFVDANPVGVRLSGYSLEELCANTFALVLFPEDLPRVAAAFTDVVNRQPRRLETRMRRKDGNMVELSLTAMPVIVCGEVVGVHGIAEDITERNQMRRELQRTQRLAESANSAKSLFLANMSHEVRTPLTSLLAATELLCDADLPPTETRLVEMVDRSGEKLLTLVNDILDFSRLEAGLLEVHDKAISMADLARGTTAWAEPLATKQELGFRCTVATTLPETLAGDDARISQVLTTLIDNALKFTQQGHVQLSIDLVGCSTDTMDVRFLVEDTGIGISADQLDGIFHSFTQADASMTRKYGGAGLGLAIAQELVTLMGGTIWAESTLGAGSTFGFTLPLQVVQPR